VGHPTAAASAYARGLSLDPRNEEMLAGMEMAKKAADRSGHTKNRREAIHQ
jgi:hypothetical protein